MRFRFTLSHSILGELQISEPDGWEDAVLKLERDKNFHSLTEYFEGSFVFYGDNGEVNGGIDFIREAIEGYGFDTLVEITIEISTNGYTYDNIFNGQLDLPKSIEMPDNKIQIPIIRDDFWSKFINRFDTPVDVQSELSLDQELIDRFGNIDLNLTSQKIRQVYNASMFESKSFYRPDNGDYLQFGYDQINLDEIREVYNLPTAINPELPVSIFDPEFAGSYSFEVRFEFSVFIANVGDIFPLCNLNEYYTEADDYIDLYIQKNDDAPILFSVTNHGESTSFYYSGVFDLIVGDQVRIYAQFKDTLPQSLRNDSNLVMYGINPDVIYEREQTVANGASGKCEYTSGFFYFTDRVIPYIPSGDENPSRILIVGDTISPDTKSAGFLLHDLGGYICDRVTSQNESFYSEILGSEKTIYKQYENDGCHWEYGIIKGLQLRQYTLSEKPFFLSFKKWWDGISPILNLGMGYDKLNGNDVIRVEDQDYFYNDDPSIYISNVRDITRSYDQERIFKTVKIGYKQWQSENTSGIDDPQTKHTYASRLQKTGSELTLESEFIAASLAIETTRRTTRQKSADYKFDNETFIIALNPNPIDVSPDTSPDVDDYLPELDENFSSITNLLNPETRYNSRITPARNFIRHLKYLSGGLQSYPGSVFKFTSGEGNYDMVSDMNVIDGCDEYAGQLSEKQDIEISDQIINLADLFEVVVPMEWEEYQVIRENRRKSIGISQTTTGHISFFIKELEYEVTKSQATIRCWPVEPMQIRVIESMFNMVTCAPVNPLTADNTLVTVDSTEITVDQTEYIL